MNEVFLFNDFDILVIVIGGLIHIFFMMVYFYKTAFLARFNLNANKEIIFYPLNNKEGYIATAEQIEKCAKANKKMSLSFNLVAYKKEVEKIFENSRKINEPLNVKIIWKNSSKKITWKFLSLWFIVAFILIGVAVVLETYFAAAMMIFLLMYPLIPFFIKIFNK